MAFKILSSLFMKQGGLFLLSILLPEETSTETADEFCYLWNAALCKPSYQISVYKTGTPDLAVDGNRNPGFYGDSCIHSHSYRDNWWMVDLMDEYLVHKVIITNRGDGPGYPPKFTSVSIDLFHSDPRLDSLFPLNENGTLCTQVTAAFQGTKSFDCLTPSYARYVKLLKKSVSFLHICEFQVMVSKKLEDPECQKTVSKHFDIERNSILNYGDMDAYSIKADTVLMCMQFCAKRGHLCNGIYWTENTRKCEILTLYYYDVSQVASQKGTDFYEEPSIQCLGNGTWKYL